MRHSWNLAVIVPFIITSLFLTSTASAHGEPLKNAEDVLFEDRIVSVDEVKRAISEDEGPLHTLHERQAGSTWWFANIFRNGTVPFGNTSYILFRNVKSYGAIGNGVFNDTSGMQAALDEGNRCNGQYTQPNPCESSTTLPAIVYVPPGTYIITSPLIMYYNTIMVGDVFNIPTIKAHPTFYGIALLDSNPYYSGGASWYANQNNFYRQVRNFILDVTPMPLSWGGGAIHWQVAQATSMQNIVMNMRVGSCATNKQQGIFMENGSGGFMRDLIMNGGLRGFLLGNQQFTSTNLTINNACTGIYLNFDWLWSFKNLVLNNCGIGIDMPLRDKPAIGHAVVADSIFNNCTIGISTTFNCSGTNKPASIGSLALSNVDFTNTANAIAYPNGTNILRGGVVIPYWMQGNSYSAYYAQRTFPNHNNITCYVPQAPLVCVQGSFPPPPISTSLLKPGTQGIFDRGKPNYDNYPLSAFISTKANGCTGDGTADDTACLVNIFNRVTSMQVVYIDHGAYRITSPITIPKNIKIMGEGWPLLMINDANRIWSDLNNPVPAIIVGNKGDIGTLEMQDVLFETMGPTPGAILMEWNLAEDAQGSAGMWDVHWRLGGTAGTQLQETTCAKNPNVQVTSAPPTCIMAFLALHITSTAELYMENNWIWIADHELDQQTHGQISVYNGRGLLVESQSAVWIVASSVEHSMLYNYGIHNAKNVYMSHIQSETAYMQNNPSAIIPFPPRDDWNDPEFEFCAGQTAQNCVKTWGLRVYKSTYVFIFGCGLYSFFENYDATCLINSGCQESAAEIQQSEAIYIFGLYSVGMTNLVQMDWTPLVAQGLNSMSFGSGIVLFEFP